MRYESKRSKELTTATIQEGNKKWWTAHTMSYDWKERSQLDTFSPAWFDDIDHRFLYGVRLFSDAANPFHTLMDTEHLREMRVLEIGCGMGMHCEMLVRAGADVTAIDLSPTSVNATMRRLELKSLPANVRQMDAEVLDFPSGSFDMVWSWGVIHHSSRTGRIVGEIDRVLRPGGNARIMVYNLEGMSAYITLATRYLFGFWRGQSIDECLWKSSDGFTARFYTRDGLVDLLTTFFDDVDVVVLGLDADAVPLPRAIRRHVLKLVPLSRQRALVRSRGSLLFAVVRKTA